MEDKILFREVLFLIWSFLANHYLFKVSYWSKRTSCEKCSSLKMKTQERRQWHRSGVLLLTLNFYFPLFSDYWLTFKMICCCNFSSLKILLTWRLIRPYLNVDTNIFTLMEIVKLPLAALLCYSTNFTIFSSNDKLVSWRYWIMMKFKASVG